VEHQAHRLLGRMYVRNEWFESTQAEALFAVYTAALPWMARLPALRPLEPKIVRPPVAGPAPRAPSSLVAAEALAPLRRQEPSPLDPLPLFRERA
jgi:hypothetical protein